MSKCGSCTMCCRVFGIGEPLNKPAGKWCQHCDVGKGCKMYDDRPMVCVDYTCLWLETLSEQVPALRPDVCKVVFTATSSDRIIAAVTDPGFPDAWRRPLVRAFIDRIVKRGLKVVVGAPNTLIKTMIDEYGERKVEMTPPDKDGMQWSV